MVSNNKMYDGKFLKEKFGFSADDFCSWTEYLKAKVELIRKNNLEAVKMNYNGYTIAIYIHSMATANLMSWYSESMDIAG